MLSSFQKRWNKFNAKQFFAFVGLALILWLGVQLTMEQEFTFEAKLELTDFPKDISVPTQTFEIDMAYHGSGLNYLANLSKWKSVPISISHLKDSVGSYFFSEEIVLDAFKASNSTNNLRLESLPSPIHYEHYYSKYLPIRSQIDFQFSPSFASFEGIKFQRDSVKVIGSKESLEKISYVSTQKKSYEDVHQSFVDEVVLEASKEYGHMLEENTIAFSIEVEQYSEQYLSIPITIEALPKGVSFLSIPEMVELFYKVPLTYETPLTSSSFEVYADFSLVRRGFKELPLEVKKKPSNVTDVWIKPQSIIYLYNKQ